MNLLSYLNFLKVSLLYYSNEIIEYSIMDLIECYFRNLLYNISNAYDRRELLIFMDIY